MAVQEAQLRQHLAECERLIGYHFDDTVLLCQALTHSSAKNAANPGNERLEFLGDAILGVIISEHMFITFANAPEGEMTRIKSAVVSRVALAETVQRLGLGAFMIIGKGLAMKSRIPTSVLANIFESVVAAIYLDGGYEPAQEFCLSTLGPLIDGVANHRHARNYKSILQQFAQKHLEGTPRYRVVDERGPDHGKNFRVGAVIGEREFLPQWGRSKKDAEQRAAAAALDVLATEHATEPVFADWEPAAHG